MFGRNKKTQKDTEVKEEENIKKKVSTQKEDTSFAMYFAKDEDLSSEIKKGSKVAGKITLDKIKHTLLIDKKAKLPKRYSAKFISLCLYDAEIQSSNRAFFYSGKYDELLLFTINKDEVTLDIVSVSKDDDISVEAENRFAGNPYIEISATEKELSAQYQQSEALVAVLLLLSIVVLGYFTYTMMFPEEQGFTEQPPPPKPIVKPLDQFEQNILKNQLSAKVLAFAIDEINTFQDRNKFNIQRIATMSMSQFTEIAQSQPILNKDSNTWVYGGDTEKLKRGGYEARISVTYQQKFPSNGYKLENEGNEEKITIYRKEESFTFKVLGTELEGKDLETKKLDDSCLNRTLRVVSDILPYSQDEQYIEFRVKKTLPSYFYHDMRLLFDGCPLEFKSIDVRGGEFTAVASMFKVVKVQPTKQENKGK